MKRLNWTAIAEALVGGFVIMQLAVSCLPDPTPSAALDWAAEQ